MEHIAGEGDVQMLIRVGGDEYEVMTSKQAAIELGYSQEHMCRLCDEGKVLAHKVAGVWWIQKWQSDFLQKV